MERNVCAFLHCHHRVGLWGVGGEGRGGEGGWRVRVFLVQVQGLVDEHGGVSVVATVEISAPGAHLPLAADVRPDARHVADVRARAISPPASRVEKRPPGRTRGEGGGGEADAGLPRTGKPRNPVGAPRR